MITTMIPTGGMYVGLPISNEDVLGWYTTPTLAAYLVCW